MATEVIQALMEAGEQITKEGLKQFGKETLKQTGKKVLTGAAGGALAVSFELNYGVKGSEAVLIKMTREVAQYGNISSNEVAINIVQNTASGTKTAIGGVIGEAPIFIVGGLIAASIGAVGTIAVAALIHRVRENE
jgi:hypothetical protein